MHANPQDIILSLTRTSRVGYLRDIRRLTVALSRARLGLYILGRREVFEACYELREAFQILLQRPDKLALVTGELWPSTRVIADENKAAAGGTLANEVAMEGVEHLGQYVYEMTKTKLQQLQVEATKVATTDNDKIEEGDTDLDLLPAPAREDEGEDIVALPDGDDDDGPRGEEAGDDDGPEPEDGEEGK